MRSDDNAGIGYDFDRGSPESRSPTNGASLSGHERDHLFLNLGGRFLDVAGASGLDHPGDGRAMAILDYDRDGFLDVAVASANAPLLQLYRNRLGDRPPAGTGANFIALRFVGGNRSAAAAEGWSNRDGYGAAVFVDLGERTLHREHRAGEGFAAQNSAMMIVGIGPSERARSISVRWPSGRTQTVADVASGTVVTVYENASESPNGEGFALDSYGPPARWRPSMAPAATDATWPRLLDAPPARLTLYTTLATWCQACIDEIPQLDRLRSEFGPEELAMVGVPYDEEEDAPKRRSWVSTYGPPYEALFELPARDVQAVQSFVRQVFQIDGIPASIVTSSDGRVRLAKWGPPTVSEIRQLLAAFEEASP